MSKVSLNYAVSERMLSFLYSKWEKRKNEEQQNICNEFKRITGKMPRDSEFIPSKFELPGHTEYSDRLQTLVAEIERVDLVEKIRVKGFINSALNITRNLESLKEIFPKELNPVLMEYSAYFDRQAFPMDDHAIKSFLEANALGLALIKERLLQNILE